MPHDPHAAVFDMIQAVETAQRLSSGLSEAEFVGNLRVREILARVSELIPLKKKEKHEGHAGEMLEAGVFRDIYTLRDGEQFGDKGFGSGSNRSNS